MATLNVVLGQRYKVIPEEVKQYYRGYYGQPPAPMDSKIQKMAIGDEPPITCRPADMLGAGWEAAKKGIGNLAKSDEDVLSYALFPQIAKPFLEHRAKGMGGKGEIVASVAAALFQQADMKAAKQTSAAADSAPAQSLWKVSGRAGMERGW
jgi:oxaloacetate decarboxylase alpha subunit